ncbi:sialidase family protein [Microbacterium sp. JZ101]
MTSRYAAQADLTPTVDRALFDGVLRPHSTQPGRTDAYIAPATAQSHASFLHRLADGGLGMVWFGGTQEGVGDISIHFSRLATGADGWSAPVRLTDDATRSEQNPVLFTTPAGELWLLYTAQHAGNQDTAEVRRRVSLDDGRSWGPVETILPATEQGGVFIRQPLVVTRTGRWLLPIFSCVRVDGRKWSGDRDTSSVMISDDSGVTWREVPVPDSTGAVHMNILEQSDGTLVALYRSRWADAIHRSESTDDGENWTAPTPIDLPNNNSSIQAALLRDDRIAIVYNHASRLDATGRRENLYDEIDDDGLIEPENRHAAAVSEAAPHSETPHAADERTAFWGAPRAPLSLAVSSDGGRSFQVLADLDQGDGFCLTNNSRDGLNREFSYPSLSLAPDGSLDIAYSYFRQTIKHVRLAPGWDRDGGASR